jgi:RNA polymerase sigma-70 factor (ECF subfamily)
MSHHDSPNPDSEPPVVLARHIEPLVAPLFAYAFRLAGSHDAAEELTQQTFLIAQQRLPQLRDAGRLKGWLFRILRNTFLKGLRKQRPVAASQLDLNLDVVVLEGNETVACDEEAIGLALAKLPDEYRVVVLMYYFEELSYGEIAKELQIPLGTVMSRLSRARNSLRRVLAAPEQMASG